ncbi:MAG TPA: aspartate kinase [Ferruginibacter sp.]|jgi:aspartate kinase|nr:aspartate kinase [Ferruginibacter sp.]
MKVFKFGGASINSIDRIKNVGKILDSFKGDPILVIISAIGKTTNALEKVAESFFAGNKEEALHLFAAIKSEHIALVAQLGLRSVAGLGDLFTEVEWLLHDKPVRDYDYYYDQIVCCGELLSTAILSDYFNSVNITNTWVDVRDTFSTDNNFREASIDWKTTAHKVQKNIVPLFLKQKIVITQGFIGATDENESTTLGREGSDYSAAIFANLLNAHSQTIWKDVEGVFSADPKKFPEATIIKELSYSEVIEMAYYGAQVIHPKTIKPIQNKDIPLHVRCFLQPELMGTIISNKVVQGLPSIIVIKEKQVLMELRSKDFSFVEEKPVGKLYELFEQIKIRPNLSQNGAISILYCLDDKSDRIEKLALAASELFDVQLEKNLTLLTVRHFTDAVLQELTKGKIKLLSQQNRDTIQIVMKDAK